MGLNDKNVIALSKKAKILFTIYDCCTPFIFLIIFTDSDYFSNVSVVLSIISIILLILALKRYNKFIYIKGNYAFFFQNKQKLLQKVEITSIKKITNNIPSGALVVDLGTRKEKIYCGPSFIMLLLTAPLICMFFACVATYERARIHTEIEKVLQRPLTYTPSGLKGLKQGSIVASVFCVIASIFLLIIACTGFVSFVLTVLMMMLNIIVAILAILSHNM